MNDHQLEFIVKGFGEDDPAQVTGRCGDVDIQVGDVFDALWRYRRRRYPQESHLPSVLEESKPVHLQVEHIHAYQQCLPMLGRGMAGALTLKGDGLNLVAPGWVLGSGVPT